jgi:hypothetical protein
VEQCRMFQKNRYLSIFWRNCFKKFFHNDSLGVILCEKLIASTPEAWKRFVKPVSWKILEYFIHVFPNKNQYFSWNGFKKAFSRIGSAIDFSHKITPKESFWRKFFDFTAKIRFLNKNFDFCKNSRYLRFFGTPCTLAYVPKF